jgi:hypothetical protein
MSENANRPTQGPLRRLTRFMARDAIWWISPILILIVLLGALVVVVEGSSLAPLVYSMF